MGGCRHYEYLTSIYSGGATPIRETRFEATDGEGNDGMGRVRCRLRRKHPAQFMFILDSREENG